MSIVERDLPGRENQLAGDELWSRQPIALKSIDNGQVICHSVLGPNGCSHAELVDVAGFARTDDRGRVEFRLSDFGCGDPDYLAPFHVVATVRGDTPGFVTTKRLKVRDSLDLAITLYAWAPDGSPLPGAFIDWRCRTSRVYW